MRIYYNFLSPYLTILFEENNAYETFLFPKEKVAELRDLNKDAGYFKEKLLLYVIEKLFRNRYFGTLGFKVEKGSELYVLDYQLGNRLDVEGSQFFLAKKFQELKDEFEFSVAWIKVSNNRVELDKFAREVRGTSTWMKKIDCLRILA